MHSLLVRMVGVGASCGKYLDVTGAKVHNPTFSSSTAVCMTFPVVAISFPSVERLTHEKSPAVKQ